MNMNPNPEKDKAESALFFHDLLDSACILM